MNGIRAKEIVEVIRAAEDYACFNGDGGMVLATVVSLDGSVYSRAGAMALFVDGDPPPGAISAQGLPESVAGAVEAVLRGRRPALAAVEIAEDDPVLGFGFCEPGKAELLLEPLDAALRGHLKTVREALLQQEKIVCAVEIEGPSVGRRELLAADHPSVRECYREATPELVESAVEGKPRRVFRCPIRPMGKVLVFGSGPEAAFLSSHLNGLGYTVAVADPRPGRLRGLHWTRLEIPLIEGGWEDVRRRYPCDEDTAVVVMNHSQSMDLAVLRLALQSPAAYIGQIGTPKRVASLIEKLAEEGLRPKPGRLFAPAGLDVGAETPEEIALGIAAEILAARSGRKGGRLTVRARVPLAAPGASQGLPGLVLAAGRGRRFSAGPKLSAYFNGKPVLRHVVENALASRLDPVIVVLGCDAEAALRTLSGIEDRRLRVVFNPLWASGKASSIEVGLRECPAGAAGLVSLLGDMPLVKSWLIDRIIEEFDLHGRLTFPLVPGPDGPRKGYPTAFPRALFDEVKALTGDDTAMAAVREHWAEAVKIPLEDAATQLDVDTPEDLELIARGR